MSYSSQKRQGNQLIREKTFNVRVGISLFNSYTFQLALFSIVFMEVYWLSPSVEAPFSKGGLTFVILSGMLSQFSLKYSFCDESRYFIFFWRTLFSTRRCCWNLFFGQLLFSFLCIYPGQNYWWESSEFWWIIRRVNLMNDF